ncbi:hypothetical protein ACVIQT_002089 [Bradyrhizobium diazoefficiens]
MKVMCFLVVCAGALLVHSLPAAAADCNINTDTMDLILAKFQAVVDGKIAQTIAAASAANDADASRRQAAWNSWGGANGPQQIGQELAGFKKYLEELKTNRCKEK